MLGKNFGLGFQSLFYLVLIIFLGSTTVVAQTIRQWEIHDPDWPRPQVIAPAAQQLPVPAPPDAVILFDGQDFSQWHKGDGTPVGWKLENDYMQVVKGTGSIRTKLGFGDCQLHLEWATPGQIESEGQGRGNSGVFLMGRYEVQVLDSYQNITYADGQAAAIYGQYPPLVNACRAPGEWQSYDIYFRRPRFDAEGRLREPARMTVVHNGMLVQNNVELTGPTGHHQRPPYTAHPDKLPLELQDHNNPVRFRNIWLRELSEPNVPFTPVIAPATGVYEKALALTVTIASTSKTGEIRYTVDDSEPTASSMLYTGPFQVQMNTNIKARTMLSGIGASPSARARYSLVKPGQNGLAFQYYEGDWDQTPDFSAISAVKSGIVYEWNPIKIANRVDHFGLVFSGAIQVKSDGEYTFFVHSEEETRLAINGKWLIDNDGSSKGPGRIAKVNLKKGRHPITWWYFQKNSWQHLELSYEGPGIIRQPIPPDLLFLPGK